MVGCVGAVVSGRVWVDVGGVVSGRMCVCEWNGEWWWVGGMVSGRVCLCGGGMVSGWGV